MQAWRDLEGTVLDGRVLLERLQATEPDAVFSGRYADVPVAVRIISGRRNNEELAARYQESVFLHHRNLLQCYGAAMFTNGESRYAYAILEPMGPTLADLLRERPLNSEQARELGLELVAALEYLHRGNLVYCALDPQTITLVSNTWKLSDYSELREAGSGYASETRRLVAVRPTTPPEAYEGVVLPGWDVWSLGCVLSLAMSGPNRRDIGPAVSRTTPRTHLPEPISGIVDRCLHPDSQQRCGLGEIQQLLQPGKTSVSEAPAAIPEPVAPSKQHRWPMFGLVHHTAGDVRRIIAFGAAAIALGVLAIVMIATHKDGNANAAPPPRVIERPRPPASPARVIEKTRPPAPQADLVPAQKRAPSETTDRASSEPATDVVTGILHKWAAASRSRDLTAQMKLYAPALEVYYAANDVSREEVSKRKRAALNKLGPVKRFEIRNVHLQRIGRDRILATFDKRWTFGGRHPYSGSVRQELDFRRIAGEWRIAGERELRVYFRSSPGPNV